MNSHFLCILSFSKEELDNLQNIAQLINIFSLKDILKRRRSFIQHKKSLNQFWRRATFIEQIQSLFLNLVAIIVKLLIQQIKEEFKVLIVLRKGGSQ